MARIIITLSALILFSTLFLPSFAEEQAKTSNVVDIAREGEQDLDAPFHYDAEDDTDTEGLETQLEEMVESSPPQCKCPKRHHKHKKHRPHVRPAFSNRDVEELNVILNSEYLEAEFFLHSAYGYGLDNFNGTSVNVTGPIPVGAQKAHTGRFVEHLAKEFGLQSMGHIRYSPTPFNHLTFTLNSAWQFSLESGSISLFSSP